MEFLSVPIFDDDFFKMIFRFTINIFFLTLVIKYLYYNNNRKIEYLFTYYMIGIIVFFLCFTLKKYELDIGMALGLFAIFGIIRYRTNSIEIKEMTYLFVIIGVSVINALANKKISYVELLVANTIIVLTMYFIERQWTRKNILADRIVSPRTQEIVYDSIENISPSNHPKLIKELEDLFEVKIDDLAIGKVDFLKKTVQISFTYNSNSTNN